MTNAVVQARPQQQALVAHQPAAAELAQYLTFVLAGEPFAIGILAIKAIIEYRGLATVPMMPANEAEAQGRRQVVGVVVDAVNEVLDIAPADIEPPPSFGARIRSDFIAGVGKVRGKFVILLDVDRVLTLDDLGAMAAAGEDAMANATF